MDRGASTAPNLTVLIPDNIHGPVAVVLNAPVRSHYLQDLFGLETANVQISHVITILSFDLAVLLDSLFLDPPHLLEMFPIEISQRVRKI